MSGRLPSSSSLLKFLVPILVVPAVAVPSTTLTATLVPQARSAPPSRAVTDPSPLVVKKVARGADNAGQPVDGIVLASDIQVDAKRLGITAKAVLPEEERLLLLAFEALASSRLDTAEHHLLALLAKFLDFHLARLALADVLAARSGRLVDLASGAAGKRVNTFRQEALARLANARNTNLRTRQPDVLLRMSKSQS
jgi:hypothetical protein